MRGPVLVRAGYALAACALMAFAAHGAEDPAARGTKLLERRHYGEAAAVLRSRLVSPSAGSQGQAVLALGVAYLKNAQLHRALRHASAAMGIDYLSKLTSERGRGGSSLAVRYLGEALLAADRPREARPHIEKFLAGSRKGTAEAEIASIDLALCLSRTGEGTRAKSLLSGVNASDPAVGSELAAAYARTGRVDRATVEMAEGALAAARAKGRRPGARILKNVAYVYARAGRPDRAVELIESADLSAFSAEEVKRKNTILRLYDPFLLEDLAAIYFEAGISWLGKAAADPRVRDAAVYYLGEAYALPGAVAPSTQGAEALAAAARLPSPYGERAVARQASGRYAAGRKAEATRDWEAISRKTDPDTMAEVLLACDRAGAPCADIAARAAAVAEKGEGKRMRALQFALGRHFLDRKDYGKAVTYLEAGRDKGYKNKIESNDPELLAALAEAYYRIRKFSEAQEIFFELGKSFPAVRQIQEALQGIYVREQKSPGDVRIS